MNASGTPDGPFTPDADSIESGVPGISGLTQYVVGPETQVGSKYGLETGPKAKGTNGGQNHGP